jgi:hypothetical protein
LGLAWAFWASPGINGQLIGPKTIFFLFFSFAGRNVLNSKVSKMVSNENAVKSKVVELINI